MKTQKTLVQGNEKETQRNTGTDGKTWYVLCWEDTKYYRDINSPDLIYKSDIRPQKTS